MVSGIKIKVRTIPISDIHIIELCCLPTIIHTIIIKYYRLSHDVVTCDVDRDVSTAYCWSLSGDEVTAEYRAQGHSERGVHYRIAPIEKRRPGKVGYP